VVFLVEIETAHEPLFTKKLSPARRLQTALTQIDEWREWINANKLAFTRDMVDQAVKCLEYKRGRSNSKGYRFLSADDLRSHWSGFGGDDDPNVHFAIIAGRWSLMTASEKKRFISKFRHNTACDVYTFEQLARQANYRPERSEG
jgi:hypothetical protein